MPKLHSRAGRLAMTGLAGGILASLAMNLQAINLGQDSPGVGAYVSAVIWPSALFVAIEIMLHTPWLSSMRDGLTKWIGLSGVAAMSAWISYWHGVHVLQAYHYDAAGAHFGPIAVDLMMTMSALALNRVGRARREIREAAPVIVSTSTESAGEMSTEAHEPNGDMWERLSRETAGENVPTSPAPAGASEAPPMRTDRGETSPVLITVIDEIISGKSPEARPGASRATIGRYAKVWRTLRDNPNAEIDPTKYKVRQELIGHMRAAARFEVVR